MRPILPHAFGAALLSLCVFTAGAADFAIDIARPPAFDLQAFKPFDPASVRPVGDGTNASPPPIDPVTATETEPNDSGPTATPIPLTGGAGRITGYIAVNTDVDFYAITAQAGDRIYAATMTAASAGGTFDSTLDLISGDGTTIIEADADDGTFGPSASVIAGATVPAAGTYFLRVRANGGGTFLRPYDLYVQRRTGTPTPEVEPNDAPPQALGATRWISGIIDTVGDTDQFAISLDAGDTVFFATDGDPLRNGDANLRVGMAPFNNSLVIINDAGATTPDGEAFFMTVKAAGDYTLYIDAPVAPVAEYHASVTVFPAPVRAGACTTQASTATTPIVDSGITTIPITVANDVVIEDVDINIDLAHGLMTDLDITLVSPGGAEVPIVTDVGNASTAIIDATFDDEAGIAAGTLSVYAGMRIRPEFLGRLDGFDGMRSQGTWNLVIRDDTAGATGTFNAAQLTICAKPTPPVACPAGTALAQVYGTDFEADDGGFTHGGTADEWERGLPTRPPITTCNSGTNCWKTDLDGTYNFSSTQDLLSPPIDLTGISPPVFATWAHRYSMESASFDHYVVTAESASVPTQRVFEWNGGTMSQVLGTPQATVEFAAGWSTQVAALPGFANVADARLRFHVDTDTSVNLSGVGVDDVAVFGCRTITADVGVTISNGVNAVAAGDTVVYTTVASSPAGATANVSASLTTTFDPRLIGCTSSCFASPGAICAGGASGDIEADLVLPPGGSTTFTTTCVLAGGATGTLTSTANVSLDAGNDPESANNAASDADPIAPAADGVFEDGFE